MSTSQERQQQSHQHHSSSSSSLLSNDMSVLSSFATKYYQRLQLDPSMLDTTPTIDKLQMIVETHLTHIPFENIAQHGGTGGLQDIEETEDRVLNRNRGGFCYELNGLLGEFLEKELQYEVCRFLSIVGVEGKFEGPPLHVMLCVRCPGDVQKKLNCEENVEDNKYDGEDKDNDESPVYLVDVAFGEPSIHPIKYIFNIKQRTPEGMKTMLVKDDDDDTVTLSWYQQGQWVPRLKWNYSSSIISNNVGLQWSDFVEPLRIVQHPESIFSQKLIVCKVTRTHKITLAGKRLKITRPGRFPPLVDDEDVKNEGYDGDDTTSCSSQNEEKKEEDEMLHVFVGEEGYDSIPKYGNVTVRDLESDMDVRIVLRDMFGIPFEETTGMDFSKSVTADPLVWSQM
jgi:arylamine N-acetyltransferase